MIDPALDDPESARWLIAAERRRSHDAVGREHAAILWLELLRAEVAACSPGFDLRHVDAVLGRCGRGAGRVEAGAAVDHDLVRWGSDGGPL